MDVRNRHIVRHLREMPRTLPDSRHGLSEPLQMPCRHGIEGAAFDLICWLAAAVDGAQTVDHGSDLYGPFCDGWKDYRSKLAPCSSAGRAHRSVSGTLCYRTMYNYHQSSVPDFVQNALRVSSESQCLPSILIRRLPDDPSCI